MQYFGINNKYNIQKINGYLNIYLNRNKNLNNNVIN